MEFINIIKVENFYTPLQYTKLGGLSINTAMNRIKANLVSHIKIDGKYFIYVKNISPSKNRKGRIQKDSYLFPQEVSISRLRNVSSYCKSKTIAPDSYYKAILSGKIFGLVIADDVFAYKDELETI